MTKCLLIIDLIEDFLRLHDARRVEHLLTATNELVSLFRSKAMPVIWVRQEFKEDLSDGFLEMRKAAIRIAIEGTSGARIDHRLDWQTRDTTIVKKRYSPFFDTPLDQILSEMRVTELVIAGVNTHACVRMAAIDAYQRDFEVIIASDCIASYDEEHGLVSLSYMEGKIARSMSNAEIAGHLRAGK